MEFHGRQESHRLARFAAEVRNDDFGGACTHALRVRAPRLSGVRVANAFSR